MNLVELEKALNIASDKFGFHTVYFLFEGDTSTFTNEDFILDYTWRRVLVNPQNEMNLGTCFDRVLSCVISGDFYERTLDEKQRRSVLGCDILYGVSLACEYWFARHYGIEFKSFGEFNVDSLKDQLKGQDDIEFGFREMGRIFDEAGKPKAYRAVAISSTLNKFGTVDEGLRKSLCRDYKNIVQDLKLLGFKTSVKLPVYVEADFQTNIENSLDKVQKDKQVRDYSQDARNVIATILSEQSDAETSLKEFAITARKILDSKLRKDVLNDNERTVLAEMFERAIEWAEYLKKTAESETVEEKI